jgi:3-phosphoshikimate 1-carboxyvinyltransferase
MDSHTGLPAAPKLPAELAIQPLGRPIDLDIAVPGSKSLTNRALIIGALAEGEVFLRGALAADDTHFMATALARLGFQVEPDWAQARCRIRGEGGRIPARGGEIFVGGAGTVMRFLSAFVCLGEGRFRLDGISRMRERPIEDLLLSLRALGVDARSELGNKCPPVMVDAHGLPGGRAGVDGSRSSQFLSALLLIAPYARAPLELEITGAFVSRPFVDLTLAIMAEFGVEVKRQDERGFMPAHGVKYRPGDYEVEGDATAASYFLAAAAILGGRCGISNVSGASAQGDSAFIGVLEKMGCRVRKNYLPRKMGIEVFRDPKVPLRPIAIDMNAMPDVAQTLAVVCLFAEGTSTIYNVANLRLKETDRLKALASELRRLGAEVYEGADELRITPGAFKAAKIETYGDHRMAMALTLAGLAQPGITIKDPACVAKTYPQFFSDLDKL